MRKALIAAAVLMLAGACSQNETSGAVGGALLGGAAGAVIGNNTGSGDAAQGAAIGAAIGAAGGAYAGCVRDGRCGGNHDAHQYRDPRGRYYFQDPQSGGYYYEDGTPYP